MKFNVNEECVFELNETKKKVIMNEICCDEFDADMKRRVRYIIEHKYEQCMKRLKEEWEPKLRDSGVKSIPLDHDELAELIFMQPQYKDRQTRMTEEQEQINP